jgi:hypothetical protein
MAAMLLRFYLGLVLLLGLAACNTSSQPNPQPASSQTHSPIEQIPSNNLARGLVFDKLRLGTKGGPCEGLLELDVPGSEKVCTHGPDAAPPGVDVRTEQSLSSLTAAATTTSVPCIGDGTSGNRVQAVYAVSSDQVDRYNDIAPLIRGWAAQIDNVFYQSALQVGGERRVRFVTDPTCNLVVNKVVLSPAASADFATMVYEMRDQLGYNNPSRKYLVWMDAGIYCGIAQVSSDDRPTADNGSNGLYPMFARVDKGCWELTYSTAVHELVHTLGGVQTSAPHATNRNHCTDDYDRLCYADGSGMPMTYPCASGNEAYLDCNHDDYFHPNPPAGSYLATHWNVANSSFLQGGTAPLLNLAPVVNAGPDLSVKVATALQLSGSASDDGLPQASALTTTWVKTSGPGTVTFSNAASRTSTATFSVAGTYVLTLTASDGVLSSSDSVTVTVNSASTTTTTSFSSSLSRRTPSRSFVLNAGSGTLKTDLSFSNSKLKNPMLTLEVFNAAGTSSGSVRGLSPQVWQRDVTAGQYTIVVTGDYVSFSLAVTHQVP